jgi:hypothetical protein
VSFGSALGAVGGFFFAFFAAFFSALLSSFAALLSSFEGFAGRLALGASSGRELGAFAWAGGLYGAPARLAGFTPEPENSPGFAVAPMGG